MNTKTLQSPLFILFFCWYSVSYSQMITGVWKGKINRQKVEIKIIQKGDSLTGTSYYYESAAHFRRYSIKGFFDPSTNEAVWWDDQLLDEKDSRFSLSTPGKMPLLSRADFNCPGGGKMMLDGQAYRKENETDRKGEVHLDKDEQTDFEDEWDAVIETYTTGGNDPEFIDSIEELSRQPRVSPVPEPVVVKQETPKPTENPVPKKAEPIHREPGPQKPAPAEVKPAAVRTPSIEEKFTSRQKLFIKELQVAGDSVELRFFDNAEIDGDSISLFLNDKLLFKHIRLTAVAYSIKLAVGELQDSNELVMVAENMGSIPPNTSYMVAIINGQRQDAYLASTEGSSAMIRLVRKSP